MFQFNQRRESGRDFVWYCFGDWGTGESQCFQWSTECYLETTTCCTKQRFTQSRFLYVTLCVNSISGIRSFILHRPLYLELLPPTLKRLKYGDRVHNSAVKQSSVDEGAREEIPTSSHRDILSRVESISMSVYCALWICGQSRLCLKPNRRSAKEREGGRRHITYVYWVDGLRNIHITWIKRILRCPHSVPTMSPLFEPPSRSAPNVHVPPISWKFEAECQAQR